MTTTTETPITYPALLDTMPDDGHPLATIATITPDDAAMLLDKNEKNRTLRKPHRDGLAKAIEDGRWRIDGGSIVVAKDGTLLDGQHRLSACVKAGKPIVSVVAWNIEDPARQTIDTGRTRTVADILSITTSTNNVNNVAAAARMLMMYLDGLPKSVTKQEVAEYATQRPELESYVGLYAGKHGPIPPSILAAAHYMFGQIDQDQAHEFLYNRLARGLGLTDGDPAATLREAWERRGPRTGAERVQWLGHIVNSWNKFRRGENNKKLLPPKSGVWVYPNFPKAI